jgi:hypothetical protein
VTTLCHDCGGLGSGPVREGHIVAEDDRPWIWSPCPTCATTWRNWEVRDFEEPSIDPPAWPDWAMIAAGFVGGWVVIGAATWALARVLW